MDYRSIFAFGQRSYPTGPLFSHTSGFFSFNLGASAAEHTYNRDLTGRFAGRQLRNIGDWLIGKELTGENWDLKL